MIQDAKACDDVIDALCSAGASVDAENRDDGLVSIAATTAAMSMRILLVCPRLQRVAALHVAAREGNSAAIRKLVSLGANLDGQNGANWTPAFCALRAGHFDSLWLLLELGADPNASGQVRYEKCTRTPAFASLLLDTPSLLLDTPSSTGRANSTARGNF